MSIPNRRAARLIVTGAAALALAIAPTALATQSLTESNAQNCYPGVMPGNPFLDSCNFGPRIPRVRGGPPDQAAVIACRGIPGCLSWYINNPH
jgi:hypothetical protein